MNDKQSMLLHRNFLGFLGMILPFLCILGGLFVDNKPSNWWQSISITYYITPALSIVLGACSVFLLCYRSYEKIDTVINILSGIFGLCIVLFPCKNPYGFEKVGYFQIPVNISNVIHIVSALIFFALLTFNIYFLFTRGHSKARNRIYEFCAYIMVGSIILYGILKLIGVLPFFSVMILETILLLCFGFAWLVKGRAIFSTLD